MTTTLTISSRGRACDPTLVVFYAVIWIAHLVLAVAILAGGALADESERWLVIGWSVFIIVLIPLALFAMRRPHLLAATDRGVVITGTGIPFLPPQVISPAVSVELRLISCCWGTYDLLILKWGKLPCQIAYLAPLASSLEKKLIATSVAGFLAGNGIDFTTTPF